MGGPLDRKPQQTPCVFKSVKGHYVFASTSLATFTTCSFRVEQDIFILAGRFLGDYTGPREKIRNRDEDLKAPA